MGRTAGFETLRREAREVMTSTRSLLLSLLAHAALLAGLASIDGPAAARLRVAGGAGSGDDGPLVRIRFMPPVPPEPLLEAESSPAEPPSLRPVGVPEASPPRLEESGPSPPAEPDVVPVPGELPPPQDLVLGPPEPERPVEAEPDPPLPKPTRAAEAVAREENRAAPVDSEPNAENATQAPDSRDGGGAGVEAPRIADPDALRPRYPLRCRRLGHEGVAVIALEVGPDGHVTRAFVVRSAGCPDLDAAALEAVRRARFHPAREHGVAVPAHLEQEFRFRLGD